MEKCCETSEIVFNKHRLIPENQGSESCRLSCLLTVILWNVVKDQKDLDDSHAVQVEDFDARQIWLGEQ